MEGVLEFYSENGHLPRLNNLDDAKALEEMVNKINAHNKSVMCINV